MSTIRDKPLKKIVCDTRVKIDSLHNDKIKEINKKSSKIDSLNKKITDIKQLLNSKRDAVNEKQSDNRLGGSKSQYDNRTAYRSNYKPVDPRKFPNPYNSMWDIFQ